MPLIDVRQLSPGVRLGLWRIPSSAPSEGGESLTSRQRERLAVQSLLTVMAGGGTIGHEPSGKPFLQPSPSVSHPSPLTPQISISHTRGYAVLMMADGGAVGVDIEYRSERVERIADRFIRPDEFVSTTLEKLLLWSAKETVYKLFSADNLMFFDMRLLSFDGRSMRLENLKRNIVADVLYEVTGDYVLTYSMLPA